MRAPWHSPGARMPKAASPTRQAAHARGLAAEARAGAYLEQLGFAIIAQRVRNKAGEIDLIARIGDLLVFCEVKVRADLEAAAWSILPRQQRRIALAAEAWLAERPDLATLNARFDAILVTKEGRVQHLPGAFEMDA